MAMIPKFCVLIGLTALLSHCKPVLEDDAGIQSLDNFKANKVGGNVCGADSGAQDVSHLNVKTKIKVMDRGLKSQETELIETMSDLLKAVPPQVLALFFGLPNNEIQIVANASNHCKNEAPNPGEPIQETVSCVKFEASPKKIIVIVSPEMKDTLSAETFPGLHHGTVRAFGFVAAYLFMNGEISASNIEGQGTQTKFEWGEKSEMGQADQEFLKSLTNSFWLDVFKEGFPFDTRTNIAVNDLITLDGANLSAHHTRITSTSNDEFLKFQIYLFAEAFDSYYCNRDKRKQMNTNFSDTFRTFDGQVNKSQAAQPSERDESGVTPPPSPRKPAPAEDSKVDDRDEAPEPSPKPATTKRESFSGWSAFADFGKALFDTAAPIAGQVILLKQQGENQRRNMEYLYRQSIALQGACGDGYGTPSYGIPGYTYPTGMGGQQNTLTYCQSLYPNDITQQQICMRSPSIGAGAGTTGVGTSSTLQIQAAVRQCEITYSNNLTEKNRCITSAQASGCTPGTALFDPYALPSGVRDDWDSQSRYPAYGSDSGRGWEPDSLPKTPTTPVTKKKNSGPLGCGTIASQSADPWAMIMMISLPLFLLVSRRREGVRKAS